MVLRPFFRLKFTTPSILKGKEIFINAVGTHYNRTYLAMVFGQCADD